MYSFSIDIWPISVVLKVSINIKKEDRHMKLLEMKVAWSFGRNLKDFPMSRQTWHIKAPSLHTASECTAKIKILPLHL